MKTLVPIIFSAFLAASPLFAEEDLLSLSIGDKMPEIDVPYSDENIVSSRGEKFLIRSYDLNNDGITGDAQFLYLLCGNRRSGRPTLLLVRYTDLNLARLYSDSEPNDGIIDGAANEGYPLLRGFSDIFLGCPEVKRDKA